jgi:hypothetical protein
VAMGEMRRGVAVPRQASIGDGGGHGVHGVGEAVVSLQGLWAVCYMCRHVDGHGREGYDWME